MRTFETKSVVSSSCQSVNLSDDDGFDSSFLTKPSLKDRLLNIPKTSSAICSDDDDSPLVLKLPAKSRFVLASDSSSDEASPALKGRITSIRREVNHTKEVIRAVPPVPKSGSCSDLEDVFSILTVDDEINVKAKTTVKPKKKKTVAPTPTPKTTSKWFDGPSSHQYRESFLSSLSSNVDPERRHPDAHSYVKNFRKLRDELTQRLFVVFNDNVFNQQLPRDFSITWNNRLTRTGKYSNMHFFY